MKRNRTTRKSVCFLTHDLVTGGIESVLLEAVNALHTAYDVEVVSLFGGAEKTVVDAFPEGVTVKVGPFCKNKIINHFRSRLYLSRFYFNKSLHRRYDYIISLKHLERNACFSNRSKYHIYWCHNDSHIKFLESNLSKTVEKEKQTVKTLYKKHDMIWAVNKIISDEMQDIFLSNNIYALPNPINCNDILKKSLIPCDRIFDKTKINIVLLGRISPEKGFGRILKIIKQNTEKFFKVHVYIIGEGTYQDTVQKYIDNHNLSDKITLLGKQTNPYPYLKQADLLVAPSMFESFGLVMMEAMLLNIPVIATETTGAKYVTQNGKYALCVENNDEALRDAIYEFIDNPDSYNYSQTEAQKWVWQHDTSKFKERILELLKECESK